MLAVPAMTAPPEAELTGRSALDDLRGAGWTMGAVALRPDTALSLSAAQQRQRMHPGGRLPAEAFALSDPRLRDAAETGALRMDVETRVFSAEAGQLDFQFSPRAGIASGFGERSAGAGVIARLGENLNDASREEGGWYLFAGAGARAVTINADDGMRGFDDAQVRQQAIVGDAQAGLAVDLGPGNLALAYTRRERATAKHSWGESRHDGFAVLSFNIVN
jgi:hypothetical protein